MKNLKKITNNPRSFLNNKFSNLINHTQAHNILRNNLKKSPKTNHNLQKKYFSSITLQKPLIKSIQQNSFNPRHNYKNLIQKRRFTKVKDSKTSETQLPITFSTDCKSLGLVGLPNVGKSTIFNALTQTQLAESGNYPFCTIHPNEAKVGATDPRLELLSKLNFSKKTTKSQLTFIDIAGLVKGASKGNGRGNQFLANIKSVSAILQVVRCFEDSTITHVEDTISPLRDIETINDELLLHDIEIIDKIISKNAAPPKNLADIGVSGWNQFLKNILQHLENGEPARDFMISSNEWPMFKHLQLITGKPMMFVCNIGADDLENGGNEYSKEVQDYGEKNNTYVQNICGALEDELNQLSKENKSASLEEISGGLISKSGLENVFQTSKKLLNLNTFYTIGETESRSWHIPKNINIKEAGGVIHTDISKNFIKCDVIDYDDFIQFKSEEECKKNGKIRAEGPNYIVKDGDILHFKFRGARGGK